MVYIVRCDVKNLYDPKDFVSGLIVGVWTSYDSALNHITNVVGAKETSCGFYTTTETVKNQFGFKEVIEYEYSIFEYEVLG